MCSCDDFEPADCFRDTERKARKAHRCVECRGRINPGETYHSLFMAWEGTAETYKICRGCHGVNKAAVDYARANNKCRPCWSIGEMWAGMNAWIRENQEAA